jgi:DNA-damage-inducible protein D
LLFLIQIEFKAKSFYHDTRTLKIIKEQQMNENIMQHQKTFEEIRQEDEDGNEFWLARQLASILGYQKWDNFVQVIDKAKIACKQANLLIADHFADISKMISLAKGAKRKISDVKLSRYACYLIVQNGDPSKPVIAAGQTYFAMQTRRQELADQQNFAQLSEQERRLALRGELTYRNKILNVAAQNAGVSSGLDYAIFQDHDYKGLYGGLSAKDIHNKKGLKKNQKILDHMGGTELAANVFRVTQTEEKLRRENIKDKHKANKTHFEVGAKVRQTIKELGSPMPEDLPTPDKSIQQLEREKMLDKPEED